MDFVLLLRVHMAPRGCFLDVVKSSDWDLFCGALVVAQEICGFWDDFVGSYPFERIIFGRRQVFILGLVNGVMVVKKAS